MPALNARPASLLDDPETSGPRGSNRSSRRPARLMRINKPDRNGTKGTVTSRTRAHHQRFPLSGTFAMACHAKSGLAQSMARELMREGIHVANVPIDAAIGWTQEDGTRAHRLAGTTSTTTWPTRTTSRRLSSTASAASIDLGVRNRVAAVGRKMVTPKCPVFVRGDQLWAAATACPDRLFVSGYSSSSRTMRAVRGP